VTGEQERRGALEALDRILNRGGDADDVLRDVLAVVARLFPYAGIRFVEEGRLVAGPSVGSRPDEVEEVPVVYEGIEVARLDAGPGPAGADDRALLERVALLVSPYCLVGWDTGGAAWEP
jgi:hypothetical protein